MPIDRPLLAPLAIFAEVMRSRQAKWYLFGAQAVLFWGWKRSTEDIDITAEVGMEEAPGFVEAMGDAGFVLRTEDWQQTLRRLRILPFLYPPTDTLLDVVVAGPGLEEEFLKRAIEVEVEGLKLSIIRPEDLITGKILAGRPKDLEDVYSILREQGNDLNLDQTRKDLSLLQTFLGREELIPRLDEQLARARSADS